MKERVFMDELGASARLKSDGTMIIVPDCLNSNNRNIPICEDGALYICACKTWDELIASATTAVHLCNHIAFQHHLDGCS